jgi:hypothetical protein
MTEQRSWQTEIEPYSRRMAGLNLLTDRLKKEVSSFPGLLEFVPTDAAQVKFRSLIYVNHTLMSSRQILESVPNPPPLSLVQVAGGRASGLVRATSARRRCP